MEDAERIKAAIDDPQGLCDALGLLGGSFGRDWKRQAHGVLIRCPWHDERTPSCSVVRARDGSVQARCFGCQVTGDAFDLVAVSQGLDARANFAAVLDLAADVAGVPRPERLTTTAATLRRMERHDTSAMRDAPDDGSIAAVAEVLADVAPANGDEHAWRYAVSRGLSLAGAAAWYAIPASRDDRERLRDVIVRRVGVDAWLSSGLAAVEGDRRGQWAWQWARSRLVIPWRAPNGTVDTLQGRLTREEREHESKYVFPSHRPPRWPWGVETFEESADDDAVVLVEGAVDAASFRTMARARGESVVVLAVPGVSAWRDEWLTLFRGRRCVVALDADKAGARARDDYAMRLAVVAKRGPRGPMVSVRRPTAAKDWNEMMVGCR